MRLFFIILMLVIINPVNGLGQDWLYLSGGSRVNTFAEEGEIIWIGDYLGVTALNKLTGKQTHFNKGNSPIGHNNVVKIAVDKNGIKWFQTNQKGLTKYDGVNWSIFDHTNSPLSEYIGSISIDSDNNLWVIDRGNNGIQKYNGNQWQLFDTLNSGLPSNIVYEIITYKNVLWASTMKGLVKFDGVNWTLYNHSNSNISGYAIYNMEFDQKGILYIAYQGEIQKFNGQVFESLLLRNSNQLGYGINSISIGKDEVIWAGFSFNNQGGVLKIKGTEWEHFTNQNSEMPLQKVITVFTDKDNSLWVGGDGKQNNVVRKIGNTWKQYQHSKYDLPSHKVEKISFDGKGNAYLASYESSPRGIVKFDWYNWSQIENMSLKTMGSTTDMNGNIFVKNIDSLLKYDGESWSHIECPFLLNIPFKTSATQIECDRNGGIWMDYTIEVIPNSPNDLSYKEGLAYFNGKEWKLFNHTNSPLPNSEINTISIDHSNNIWVATLLGLFKFDGTNWVTFNQQNGNLPYNNIQTFAVDTEGYAWIPNKRYGFLKLNGVSWEEFIHPTMGQFIAWGEKMAADIDGSIWQIAGANTLQGFDGEKWTVFNSDNSPILSNNNVICINIDNDGNKWIGNRLGGVLVYKNGGVTIPDSRAKKAGKPVVYPNPFYNQLTFELPEYSSSIELILYDEVGRKVLLSKFNDSDRITLTNLQLPTGVYYYRIQLENDIVYNGVLISN